MNGPETKLRRSMADGPGFWSTIITVLVGEDEEVKKFLVHQDQLTISSEFFKKALSGDWEESSTRTVQLPETDVTAFGIYVKWLYSGKFYIMEDNDKSDKDEDDLIPDHELDKWHSCYVLGSFLQDLDFKDALIDMLIEKARLELAFSIHLVESVYDFSLATSPHRELVVHAVAHVWPNPFFQIKVLKEQPAEFLADLLVYIGPPAKLRIFQAQSVNDFFKDLKPCRYHEHTLNNSPCYKTKKRFFA
ncbi:hypothetical protein P153DRAFT_400871 [Dothidotthia symphoricarpi CBS 119687]|uniref:BTB domain-containing protein n=1 Tax=Dothidotthia symphoricarpi CBS 119687 TaxID=1392245 RepID=A0A6A6A2I8_9PLEO|nr:uncharacterized protein P153DRAFT_400871 [Dothidotthia symphoricarpi CBS 119687]KAF2124791.1 hypothetical protein P153DRAFT_400871 [Dothidotthia symphoricarpi CBS 119687]